MYLQETVPFQKLGTYHNVEYNIHVTKEGGGGGKIQTMGPNATAPHPNKNYVIYLSTCIYVHKLLHTFVYSSRDITCNSSQKYIQNLKKRIHVHISNIFQHVLYNVNT